MCLLSVVAVSSHCYADFVFANGQQNTVDYQINDYVVVTDSQTGAVTEVTFLQGAMVLGTLQSEDDSLIALDNSRVRVEGGSFVNDVVAADDSQLVISGGQLNDDVQLYGEASILITGGVIADDVETYGGTLSITGGTFAEDIEIFEGSAELSGGTFNTSGNGRFRVGADGSLVIVGRELTVNGTAVGSGQITDVSGLISGTLADGSTFTDIRFSTQGGQGFLGFQAVPEPTSGSLVLLATLALGFRRIRRN